MTGTSTTLTTPTSTTSTTTTLEALEAAERVDVIGKVVRAATISILDSLTSADDEATFTSRDAGSFFTVVAKKIRKVGNRTIAVEVKDAAVNVSIPPSFLPQVFPGGAPSGNESAALVVTAFDEGGPMGMGTRLVTDSFVLRTEVKAVISIEFWRTSWGNAGDSHTIVHVKGVDPLEFNMPVNSSEGAKCAYWDEEALAWSTGGVETTSNAAGSLRCRTTHLSFFAAIVQGYIYTLQCSQFSLFTIESIKQLGVGDWQLQTGSMSFWIVQFFLISTFTVAIIRDSKQSSAWSNEFFLVARNEGQRENTVDEADSADAESVCIEDPNHVESPQERTGLIIPACMALSAFCSAWCEVVRHSNSLRDAIDDILSSWFEYFSDVRTIVEELCKALEITGHGTTHSTWHIINFRVTSHLLTGTLRRMVGAHVGVSDELVSFVMDSKELRTFLTEESTAPSSGTGLVSSITAIAEMNMRAAARANRHSRRSAAIRRHYQQRSSSTLQGSSADLEASPSREGEEEGAGLDFRRLPSLAEESEYWEDSDDDMSGLSPRSFRRSQAHSGRRPSRARTPAEIIRDLQQEGSPLGRSLTASSSGDLERQESFGSPGRGSLVGFRPSQAMGKVASLVPDWVGHQASIGVLGRGRDWRHSLNKTEAWIILHHEISEGLQRQNDLFSHKRGLCRMIFDVFVVQNPFVAALLFNPMMTSKMRTLFLAIDVLGTLALSALFFQTSGTVRGKAAFVRSSGCLVHALSNSLGYKFGRVLAIATGSVLVSGIPVALMSSLHTRNFRIVDYEGSRAWRRQLRAWNVQDIIVWTLGSIYVCFCIFYIQVFLANVSERDQQEWTLSLVLAVVQITLLVPVVVAATIPTLAWLALNINDAMQWFGREELIRSAHERMHETSNIMLPIAAI